MTGAVVIRKLQLAMHASHHWALWFSVSCCSGGLLCAVSCSGKLCTGQQDRGWRCCCHSLHTHIAVAVGALMQRSIKRLAICGNGIICRW